jgi:hypothetical protein
MAGPNEDKQKAEKLRRFALPNEYIEPWSPSGAQLWKHRIQENLADQETLGSHEYIEHEDDDADSEKSIRGVSVFLSIVCEDRVYVVMDFSRLVRIFINSREQLWNESDMCPTSWVRYMVLIVWLA